MHREQVPREGRRTGYRYLWYCSSNVLSCTQVMCTLVLSLDACEMNVEYECAETKESLSYGFLAQVASVVGVLSQGVFGRGGFGGQVPGFLG